MWKLFYNIGLLLAAPVILVVLLAKPRCRPGLAQRLGLEEGLSGLFRPSRPPDRPNRQDRPDRPIPVVVAANCTGRVPDPGLCSGLVGRLYIMIHRAGKLGLDRLALVNLQPLRSLDRARSMGGGGNFDVRSDFA